MKAFIIFRLKYFYNRVIITLFVQEKNLNKNSTTMKQLLKYLGVIVLLIGVAILAVYSAQGLKNNTILVVGLATIIIGYLGHIVINKKLGEE